MLCGELAPSGDANWPPAATEWLSTKNVPWSAKETHKGRYTRREVEPRRWRKWEPQTQDRVLFCYGRCGPLRNAFANGDRSAADAIHRRRAELLDALMQWQTGRSRQTTRASGMNAMALTRCRHRKALMCRPTPDAASRRRLEMNCWAQANRRMDMSYEAADHIPDQREGSSRRLCNGKRSIDRRQEVEARKTVDD